MPIEILKVQPITIARVKELLESLGEENLDQFQRRTLDYANKFSKVSIIHIKELIKELEKNTELEKEEIIQIINSLPTSIEELRGFLSSGRKIIESKFIFVQEINISPSSA